MKTTVIFHSADFDGLFCREIARKFLPGAELIGWDYGQPPIPFTQGQVYVLDLSPDCLETLSAGVVNDGRLVWIDHHKTAIDKYTVYGPQVPGYRIDGVAACRLAWQWFAKGRNGYPWTAVINWPEKQHFLRREVEEPLAVRLAGEYDIWDKRDPRAELFQYGLRSGPLTDGIWDELLEPRLLPNLVQQLLDRGEAVQYAKTQENESIIKHLGFTIRFEGLTFLACNHARYNSFLFTAGLKPEHDACFGFKWNGKGKWEVSLYHAPGKEHHDLSQIAVKYGGGGHRGACGFIASHLPFLCS